MQTIATLAYLLAATFFIFGLKRLSKVRTAREGNALAAVGMLIAIITTLAIQFDVVSWPWIIAGLVIGAGIGAVAAVKVQMTAMPEMVALFNGSGGIASALVALAYFFMNTKVFGGGTSMAST